MNIVACIKRVPATETQPKLTPDSRGMDSAGVEHMLSFYDEIAVEEALRTRDDLGGEVTVLTLGPSEASKEVRDCLAKGADRGLILTDPNWGARDSWSTARVLAGKIEELGVDLVFCGKVATDRDNAAVAAMIATRLGWACVTEVIELELAAEGECRARREVEGGVETYTFSLPAVISCQKGLNEPRYAGLKGIMAAKKKPLDEESFEDIPSQAVVVEVALPAPRGAGRIVGEGAAAVADLVQALRDEAKVL